MEENKPKIEPFADLLKSKGDDLDFTYAELLLTTEWQERRKQIIERDNNCCQMCSKTETNKTTSVYQGVYTNSWVWIEFEPLNFIYSDKPYFMQVHHKYYLMDRLPWDYSDDALVTLCQHCHQHMHETQRIVSYPNEHERELFTTLTPCSRCGGTGTMPEYTHVQHGVCFGCGGSRFEEFRGGRF